MDRDWATIDWFLVPLCILAIYAYFKLADPEDHSDPIMEFFALGFHSIMILMIFGMTGMLWMMGTHVAALNGVIKLPPQRVKTEVIIVNNTASCPEGYTLKEGRRSSLYCEKEVPYGE